MYNVLGDWFKTGKLQMVNVVERGIDEYQSAIAATVDESAQKDAKQLFVF